MMSHHPRSEFMIPPPYPGLSSMIETRIALLVSPVGTVSTCILASILMRRSALSPSFPPSLIAVVAV
jgi:hypothetical protein